MAYTNIPGTEVRFVDGNLRLFEGARSPLVLLIGAASQGFTEARYDVTDSAVASTEFGKNSELVKAMYEARDGGAKGISLVRLPGTAPKITHIGNHMSPGAVPDSTGISITPTLKSSEAADRYAVAYKHVAVTGPAGDAVDASTVVGEVVVVDTVTEELVYYGSKDLGTIYDTGAVEVDFDTIYTHAGSTALEVLALTVVGTATDDGTVTFSLCGIEVEAAFQNADEAADVAEDIRDAINNDGVLGEYFLAAGAGANVVITVAGDADADGNFFFGSDMGVLEGQSVRPFLTSEIEGEEGITVSFTAPTKLAASIGIFPTDPMEPYADGTFVAISLLKEMFDNYNELNIANAASIATFEAGATKATMSACERYEKLHQVFSLLDFSQFNLVVPVGATLDHKNVADLESGEISALGLAGLSDYPEPNSMKDVLGKLAIKDNGDFTYTYYWDIDNDGIAEFSSDGVPGGGSGLVYTEVNFAHLLALFCYKASENYQVCHGVIGTTVPKNLSDLSVNRFFGKVPTYTKDATLGYVIASQGDNGSGLLGHKLVGGKYGFRFNQKGGGLVLTTDEKFSSMSTENLIVKDENDAEVDLGKYISVVAQFGYLRNEFESRGNGYLTNLAAFYAGIGASTTLGDSTTARQVRGVTIPYYLAGSRIDEIAGSRLVVFMIDQGIPTVVDGVTFALEKSDYRRFGTFQVLADLAEGFRIAAKPFLGKGLDTSKTLALEQAFQAEMQKAVTEKRTIRGGAFKMGQTRADRIAGIMNVDLEVMALPELRKIKLRLSLSAE